MTKGKDFSKWSYSSSFEKKGWPETKVVIRFWILAIAFALIGLSSLKLR